MLEILSLAGVVLLAISPFLLVTWGIRAFRRGATLSGVSLVLATPGCCAMAWVDLPLGPLAGLALAAGAFARRQANERVPAVLGAFANALALVLWVVAPPPWIKPRIAANEAMTIGDLRTLVSAQSAFGVMNGGLAAEPVCLRQPRASGCLTGSPPPDERAYADDSLLAAQKAGYARTFHAGQRPTEAQSGAARAAARSLRTWAMTAVPQEAGATGVRGFCADSRGILCSTREGQEPPLTAEGLCLVSEGTASPPGPVERVRIVFGFRPPARCHLLR
jgi:hypothetical protein